MRKGRAGRLKLESFWRAYLKGWRDSNLNQREYCELRGLPLKRFGNWRAAFKKDQTIVPEALLWWRGGGDQPRLKPRSRSMNPSPTPPRRRRLACTDNNRKRIINEACGDNASVSGAAPRVRPLNQLDVPMV